MTPPSSLQELIGSLPTQIESANRLGLVISQGLDADSWSRLVTGLVQTAGRLSTHRDTLTAWLGDLLAYGEGQYRGQIKEYARAAGLEASTLRNAKLVCSRIPVSCRRDTLSWSHHCEIGKAFKDPAEIEQWLKIAENEKLSRAELRRRIRSHLAESTESAEPTASADIEFFAVLRELRGVDRFVQNRAGVWTRWSPAACKRALSELASVSEFLGKMSARAGEAL